MAENRSPAMSATNNNQAQSSRNDQNSNAEARRRDYIPVNSPAFRAGDRRYRDTLINDSHASGSETRRSHNAQVNNSNASSSGTRRNDNAQVNNGSTSGSETLRYSNTPANAPTSNPGHRYQNDNLVNNNVSHRPSTRSSDNHPVSGPTSDARDRRHNNTPANVLASGTESTNFHSRPADNFVSRPGDHRHDNSPISDLTTHPGDHRQNSVSANVYVLGLETHRYNNTSVNSFASTGNRQNATAPVIGQISDIGVRDRFSSSGIVLRSREEVLRTNYDLANTVSSPEGRYPISLLRNRHSSARRHATNPANDHTSAEGRHNTSASAYSPNTNNGSRYGVSSSGIDSDSSVEGRRHSDAPANGPVSSHQDRHQTGTLVSALSSDAETHREDVAPTNYFASSTGERYYNTTPGSGSTSGNGTHNGATDRGSSLNISSSEQHHNTTPVERPTAVNETRTDGLNLISNLTSSTGAGDLSHAASHDKISTPGTNAQTSTPGSNSRPASNPDYFSLTGAERSHNPTRDSCGPIPTINIQDSLDDGSFKTPAFRFDPTDLGENSLGNPVKDPKLLSVPHLYPETLRPTNTIEGARALARKMDLRVSQDLMKRQFYFVGLNVLAGGILMAGRLLSPKLAGGQMSIAITGIFTCSVYLCTKTRVLGPSVAPTHTAVDPRLGRPLNSKSRTLILALSLFFCLFSLLLRLFSPSIVKTLVEAIVYTLLFFVGMARYVFLEPNDMRFVIQSAVAYAMVALVGVYLMHWCF